MVAAGKRVSSCATWACEMRALADASLAAEDLMRAAFYVRAEEFYTISWERRASLYEESSDLAGVSLAA